MNARARAAGIGSLLPAVGLALCLARSASAQLDLTASLRYLNWREDTAPIEVRENGVLLPLGLRYEAPFAGNIRWVYDGEISIGAASYQGAYLFDPGTPATGTSGWFGTAHELRLRFGTSGPIEPTTGVAFDLWRWQLGARQEETYRMASVRLGLEGLVPALRGWRSGGGLDLPFWIEQDAQLDDPGFGLNPTLSPGKKAGMFAHVAYRAASRWTWSAEWEMTRLGKSEAVPFTINGRPRSLFQPATVMNTVGVRMEYRVGRAPED